MQRLQSVLIGCLVGMWLWAIAPASAAAQTQAYDQNNQGTRQSASLVAPEPEMKIDIYPQPDTRKSPIGYGLNGDAVVVLEQTGSNEGTVWNRIQFAKAPDSEGWVQLEYLSLPSGNQPSQQHQGNPKPGGYMGERSAQPPGARQSDSPNDRSSRYQQGQQQYNR
ncbi:MAG: hypothetical protein AAGD09_11850 [Cyanobacteria bacterium P01_F01_bin.56]